MHFVSKLIVYNFIIWVMFALHLSTFFAYKNSIFHRKGLSNDSLDNLFKYL